MKIVVKIVIWKYGVFEAERRENCTFNINFRTSFHVRIVIRNLENKIIYALIDIFAREDFDWFFVKTT